MKMEKAIGTVANVKTGEFRTVLQIIFNDKYICDCPVSIGEYCEDKKEYKENEEIEKKTNKFLEEHFGTTFDDLELLKGKKVEVYTDYEKASIYEPGIQLDKIEEKVDAKVQGVIEIAEIDNRGILIAIRTEEGKLYRISGFDFKEYVEDLETWFISRKKEVNARKNFDFLFDIELADTEEAMKKQIEELKGLKIKSTVGDYSGHKFLSAKESKVMIRG